MPYARRISVADAVDTGYPGYQAVFVASPESANVLAGFLDNGGTRRCIPTMLTCTTSSLTAARLSGSDTIVIRLKPAR